MSFEQRPKVKSVQILKVSENTAEAQEDLVVVEEPLEIRLGYGKARYRKQHSLSVTMRTPGNDFELALGFLFTEGIIKGASEITRIEHCTQVDQEEALGNVVKVELREEINLDLKKLQRNFYTASSCGVCGKSSLEAVMSQGCAVIPLENDLVSSSYVAKVPELSQAAQVVFKHTGGLHSASILDGNGQVLVTREDVGRHNAVDKVIGAMLGGMVKEKPLILFLSGRAGFELIQKAGMAQIPIVAAVGAPSSLAVEMAERFGITLIGFLRNGRFNVYSNGKRVSVVGHFGK